MYRLCSLDSNQSTAASVIRKDGQEKQDLRGQRNLLSNIPDEVLCRVLSFLSTRDILINVRRTSRRLRNIIDNHLDLCATICNSSHEDILCLAHLRLKKIDLQKFSNDQTLIVSKTNLLKEVHIKCSVNLATLANLLKSSCNLTKLELHAPVLASINWKTQMDFNFPFEASLTTLNFYIFDVEDSISGDIEGWSQLQKNLIYFLEANFFNLHALKIDMQHSNKPFDIYKLDTKIKMFVFNHQSSLNRLDVRYNNNAEAPLNNLMEHDVSYEYNKLFLSRFKLSINHCLAAGWTKLLESQSCLKTCSINLLGEAATKRLLIGLLLPSVSQTNYEHITKINLTDLCTSTDSTVEKAQRVDLKTLRLCKSLQALKISRNYDEFHMFQFTPYGPILANLHTIPKSIKTLTVLYCSVYSDEVEAMSVNCMRNLRYVHFHECGYPYGFGVSKTVFVRWVRQNMDCVLVSPLMYNLFEEEQSMYEREKKFYMWEEEELDGNAVSVSFFGKI